MTAAFACRSTGLSHVGRVRRLNEDAWLARPDLGLWAVADGMGGHRRGDLASRTIVEALGRLPPPTDAPAHLRAVEAALSGVHAVLHRVARDETGDVCGSTVAVLLAFERHFAVLWAGDSRVYRLRARRLERLTRDHSLVEELMASGRLDAEAARVHPLRNRITRAVGVEGPLLLERRQGELAAGDLFLLCSDGLTGHLDDETIAGHLAGQEPETAAVTLVEATLAEGASDNVTVVLVAVEEATAATWPGR
jgi:serine/threonine protein phosphatase PrpC